MASKVRVAVNVSVLLACIVALAIWDESWKNKALTAAVVLAMTYFSFEAHCAMERIHRMEHRLGLGPLEDDAEWQKARPSLGYKD